MRGRIRRQPGIWLSVFPLLLLLLLPGLAVAQGGAETLSVTAPAEAIRPGMASIISFTVPKAGVCSLRVLDEAGQAVSVVFENREASAGYNSLYWNGTWNGAAAPEGVWLLTLEQDGQTVQTAIRIGPVAAVLVSARIEPEEADQGETVVIRYTATRGGVLTLSREEPPEKVLKTKETAGGAGTLRFTAGSEAGEQTLLLSLKETETGLISGPIRLRLKVRTAEETLRDAAEKAAAEAATPTPSPEQESRWRTLVNTGFTPAYTSPYRGRDTDLNYWTLPMDITDEEAVWQALTRPITVVDNRKKNAEKTQVILRAAPDENSEGLGVVTCITQGVHVLERGEAWSLVECYSSSFHDSPILNWNALVQGYVPTAYLKETVPSQELGIVIDKLTQRLYLFQNGRLLSTLLVSTGLANARQPYNETRAGEYLLTSAVGTFASDDLYCALALRFNRGDLLHETPYTLLEDGSRNYRNSEIKLGKKASHGCIRVQRKKTPEGINQAWIWSNRKQNIRVLIWEDWQGRQIPVPAAETTLYWKPGQGKVYHSQEHCYGTTRAGVTLLPFSYSHLEEEPYASLKRCEYCAPPLREAEIAEINRLYAPGGDHNPVLTEALKTCPRKLKKK